eukprot:CAMPEP_0194082896 /NCGR_PEP_ID=MMETSP0149-20130528/8299_1 /TAXON_ID=122233 /ORGANISM="Chaetoceros debilis, Strain MM31A-1" /LENGTH=348 /DNA_ID=CAMNT_0038765171 /DNA_START=26 /DNA_END=1068 /DNA_ORIENTATION=-
MVEKRPSTLKVWILASRPHTLTASIAPVLVGQSLIRYGYFGDTDVDTINKLSYITFLWGAFACLIQLGTNLHNDYADFVKGADTEKRVGQARATQKGWLTPFQTAAGSTVCLFFAAVIGSVLTKICSGGGSIDPYMTFITISSIFNAVCYTGGPYPLGYIGLGNLSIGYSGLGDLFVFLYFGIVATVTVPYIHMASSMTLNTSASGIEKVLEIFLSEKFRLSWLVSLPIGFLGTAIIAVNNLRDRETDVTVGKNTLAVRFGERFTRVEYMNLVKGSYIFLIFLARSVGDGVKNERFWLYLPLLSYPLARKELNALMTKDGASLNPHVGGTARVQLVYCILLMYGLRMA